MKKLKLGIVGASGLVGQTIIKILIEENLFDKLNIELIASDKSVGAKVKIKNKDFIYKQLDNKLLKTKFDFLIFSAGDEISKKWAEKFANKGAFIIDNSNAFRRDKNIPLIVPEINKNLINENTKIIANPNCSTIQLALVVDKLLKLGEISELIVSTYQSVSGAGKEALNDLIFETKNVFSEGIKDNIIPVIGTLEENGFSTEENKIMFELNKILNLKINVIATAVRVPIPYCHGESVCVKFLQNINKFNEKMLFNEDYLEFSENIHYPNNCSGTNKTYISRLRIINKNCLNLFIIADNLRRGAGYNAVLILKELIKKYNNM